MCTQFKKIVVPAVLLLICSLQLPAQKKIEFPSKDGLVITANLFMVSDSLPYMILCHQAGASRAEYNETATKFTKFMYNVLAIDMRSGNEINGVKNETVQRAREKKTATEPIDAEQDIVAAIDYCYSKSKKKVILVGSSFSASLVLKIAAQDNRVKAVLAFSPGEYFGKAMHVKESISKLTVPVFVACTREEAPATTELMAAVRSEIKMEFKPPAKGMHGSRALWKENVSSADYWLAVVMFMRQTR
jgi:dienelactone hydrolase